MFGSLYFYHGTIHRVTAIFGYLFSNIKIVRTGPNGNINKIISVPCRYAVTSKEKAAAFKGILEADNIADKYYETFPKIAYELDSVDYNSSLQKNILNNYRQKGNGTKSHAVGMPAPYNLSYTVYFVAKSTTDAWQIFEQIASVFRPSLVVSIKSSLDSRDEKLTVSLEGSSFEDNWEEGTDPRQVEFQMKFNVKGALIYGPMSTPYESAVQKFIKKNGIELADVPKGLPVLDDPNEHYIIETIHFDYADDITNEPLLSIIINEKETKIYEN